MEFTVIPDEQTPITPEIDDVSKFIEKHKEEIEAFKQYAISRRDGIGLAANQCALDGFFINQIYSIENPKDWQIGFSHFFVVWKKDKNKNLGLLYNPVGTQLKLGDF